MLVLTGAGGEAFCAGADLKAMDLDVDHPDGPMGPTRLTPSKPAIAAVDGWCLAGGVELALWCDLRIATPRSTFGLFERRWGVPLIDGGTQRLPRVVGMGRALELILTGRPVDAEEAHRIGLVNEVVEPGTHLDRALELAERIAAFPQETMLADRRAAIEGFGLPLADGLALEHQARPRDARRRRQGRRPLRRRRGPPRRGRLASGLAVDPPHLVFGRFRAQVGHQHGEDQVGQDPLQLRPAAGAHLVEDHRGGAADREAGGVGGQLVALARVGAALLEEGGEAGQHRPVALARVIAGGGHLDHRHPGDVGLGGEQLDQGPQPGGDLLRPGLVRGRLEGGRDVGDEDVDDRVVGLQEAGLLARRTSRRRPRG